MMFKETVSLLLIDSRLTETFHPLKVLLLFVGVVSIMAYPGLYLPPPNVLVAPKVPIIRHQLVPIGTILKTYPTIVSSSRHVLFQQRFGRKLNCNTTESTTTTTTMAPTTEAAAVNSVLIPTTEELPTTTSTFQETTEVPETTTITFNDDDEEEKENVETTTTPNEVEEVTDLPEVTTELPQLKVLEVDLPLEIDNRIADEVEMTTLSQPEWDEKDNEIDAVIVREDGNVDHFDEEDKMVESDDNLVEQKDSEKPLEMEGNYLEEEQVTTEKNVHFEKEEDSELPIKKEEDEDKINNETTETFKETVIQEPSTTVKVELDNEEGSGSGLEGSGSVPSNEEVKENKDLAIEVNEMAETESKEKEEGKPTNYAQLDLPENLLNSYSSAFFQRFADSPFLNIQQHPIQIPLSIKSTVPSSGTPLIKSYRPLLRTAAYTAALHPLPVFKKTTTTTTVEQHHHPQHFIHTHDGVALNYAPAVW